MNWKNPFSTADAERARIEEASPQVMADGASVGIEAAKLFAADFLNPLIPDHHTDVQAAILALYFRIFGHLRSLLILNEPAHFQAIAALTRSVFELGMDVELLVREDSGVRTDQFHAFHDVARYRAAGKVVRFYEEHGDLPGATIIKPQQEFFDGEEKAASMKVLVLSKWGKTKQGKPRWPYHWSGVDARERARRLGEEWEERYVRTHDFLNWQIHSGSVGVAGLQPVHFMALSALCLDIVRRVAVSTFRIVIRECALEIEESETRLQFLDRVAEFVVCDFQLMNLGEPRRFYL